MTMRVRGEEEEEGSWSGQEERRRRRHENALSVEAHCAAAREVDQLSDTQAASRNICTGGRVPIYHVRVIVRFLQPDPLSPNFV